MKIRTILTFQYTTVTAALLLLIFTAVYLVSEHTRSNTFYRDLRSEAVTKAHLFLSNRVDPQIMHSIYLNNRQFINEVEVAVYDQSKQMLYHDAMNSDIVKETDSLLDSIACLGEVQFRVGHYQAIGLVYPFGQSRYLVTAAAYDGYGMDNLQKLKQTLGVIYIVCLSVLFAAGYWLARVTLKPIRDIVREAEHISASSFDRRLPVRNEKDELGELSLTFNALLDRLEKSFMAQKMFVSNVSHELRTPLAALTAELDLLLQKERTSVQYQTAVRNVLQDASHMNRLVDGLLNLAKADYLPERIKMEEVRLDELLLDAREFLRRAHPGYQIELLFEQEDGEDDRMITVKGNPYLLNIAFSNLMENNCKYSADQSAFVLISYWEKWTIVRLSDNGTGLSETDKQNLFTLFYRGEQEQSVKGHGIGMTLAQKIIHLHGGSIAVHSELGQGTTFVVELPHV